MLYVWIPTKDQAILEIITNETSLALLLLAKTNTQLRTAVYQNRLALDYLLTQEGGVCGKFNFSNCCLQINDNGEAIEEITDRMRKLTHVPVQTWEGIMDSDGFFGGLFGDWKQVLFMLICAFGGLMLLPCLIAIIRSTVTRTIEGPQQKISQESKGFCICFWTESKVQNTETERVRRSLPAHLVWPPAPASSAYDMPKWMSALLPTEFHCCFQPSIPSYQYSSYLEYSVFHSFVSSADLIIVPCTSPSKSLIKMLKST
ncbi:Endogenous retrovirus group 3 member 1 Env polyprotein [Varanus komodoensis]|nr:Endogenous retrovirus group 3 member 1 Env polyprotein [Varanus komodoensis]